MLVKKDVEGRNIAIDTPEKWAERRAELKSIIEFYLGEKPVFSPPPPVFHCYEENDTPDYRHLLIGYEVEPGEEVKAHLLLPPKEKRLSNAAVLCLHGTSTEAKDTQMGLGQLPGRDWGRYLARRGFVTLSPDHACSGERQPAGVKPYDSSPFYARHPRWSMMGKAIWDGERAVDILCQLTDEVDPERIGVIGHSLGGYGSIFLAAFDSRIKVAVSSCGLTTWEGNPKRMSWARDTWYIHFPMLREIFLKDMELPFDMHEFAALIAPRAFLNISGMSDKTYAESAADLPEVGWQLYSVYNLLGAAERFAWFLFGAGHDVPNYSQALAAAWLERWLVN
ncbi:MAG TPA: prolyl oligopeptidase family serine peptidase [Firmicutes bacterium]|nr:prolyl oligopeptidase family serine peptidase [Bacillota bacterium]